MLNSKTFPFTTLKDFSFIPSSFMAGPRSYLSSSTTLTENNNSLKKQQISQSVNRRNYNNSQPINTNNMKQQVEWFNKRRQYKAIIKIIIFFISGLLMFSIGICSLVTLVMMQMLLLLITALEYGIFKRSIIENWVLISLFGFTFVIVNQILTSILKIISPFNAELIDKTNFTLIPSFQLTLLLALIFVLSPYVVNNILMTPNVSIKGSFFGYFKSLNKFIKNINLVRYQIFQAFTALFLIFYIIIAFLSFDEILYNGTTYINMVHPITFLAQGLTIIVFLLSYHFIIYSTDFILNKIKPFLFNQSSSHKKIPTLIQLLNVAPTEQIIKQLQSQNMLVKFSIFSLTPFLPSNNLTIQSLHIIYKTSLTWIINALGNKLQNLNNKIYIYNTVGCNKLNQYKSVTSYWQYLKQFTNTYLNISYDVIGELNVFVTQISEMRDNKKSILDDLFYQVRLKKKEFQLWRKMLKSYKYLNTCHYIFEILCLTNINLSQQAGQSPQILLNMKRIYQLTKQIGEIVWLPKAMKQNLKQFANKTKITLKKSQINVQ